MNLKEIKKDRIGDMKHRIVTMMYDNYYGGDTIVFKNCYVNGATNQFGVIINDYHFTVKELEFIEKENILDEIRKEGWEITMEYQDPAPQLANGQDVIFTFKPI
jgi:hypothetical protein